MTGAEVKRLSGAMHLLRRLRLPCYYAVLGDHLLDLPEDEARKIFSNMSSYLVQAQGRRGLPQYWLRILESTGGLHANIIFPGSDALAEQLLNSKYGQYLGANGQGLQAIGAAPKDWNKVTSYLAAERVPQGDRYYRKVYGPRMEGSHRLGKGGGDRVILSPALRQAAVEAGLVSPFTRTTSRNLTRPVSFPLKPQDSFGNPDDLGLLRQQLGLTEAERDRRLGLSGHRRSTKTERQRPGQPTRHPLQNPAETSKVA